jgi:hypothetical protein
VTGCRILANFTDLRQSIKETAHDQIRDVPSNAIAGPMQLDPGRPVKANLRVEDLGGLLDKPCWR